MLQNNQVVNIESGTNLIDGDRDICDNEKTELIYDNTINRIEFRKD